MPRVKSNPRYRGPTPFAYAITAYYLEGNRGNPIDLSKEGKKPIPPGNKLNPICIDCN